MINSRSLDDLRPDVRANVEQLLDECARQGLRVLITQTLRDDEYQATLYAQGRTRPGQIITNSRVTTFHGKGLAFDFCQNVKGQEYADPAFFTNVATIAKHIGFSWGGDLKTFPDRPHLQWDEHGKISGAMLRTGRLPGPMPAYKKEGSKMSLKDFSKLFFSFRAQLQDEPPGIWSGEARAWAEEIGLIQGGDGGKKMYRDFITREQIVVLLFRFFRYLVSYLDARYKKIS